MEENVSTNKNTEIEAYDTVKINGIKKLIEYQLSKNIPVSYRITLDKNDIVQRSNDITQFDNYIGLLGSGKKLIISTYNCASAKHVSNKWVFDLSNIAHDPVFTAVPQTLNGPETKEQWKAEVMKEYTALETTKKLTETEKRLSEAEDFMEKQRNKIEALKAEIRELKEGGSIKDIVLALAQHPKVLEKIPAVAALSGLPENKGEVKEEGTASFTKDSPAFEMSEDEKKYVEALRCLEHDEFEKGQKEWFIKIIDQLVRKKEDIKTVAELLNITK